ncbi:MAG: MBOAT family protein [Vicingaceae bacterium]
MVFSSLIFLFSYLPFLLLGNYLWRNRTWQNVLLFIGSLYFYAWGEGEKVFIMLGSIVLNYYIGRAIGAAHLVKKKKIYLTLGIIINLSVLVYFKYAEFLIDNLNSLANIIGLEAQINFKAERLPIGISFYTFQSISYLIDVYREENKAQKNFIDVGLYISLFPQLIAGPIVRYHDIAHQLEHRTSSIEKFSEGIRRFITGLGKKVLIANNMAYTVDEILALGPTEITTPLAWMAITGYALQIYFDFSGYSDMAIGLGKMFGFDILENFNFPYITKSIREFWRRWHISLSNWFVDYLYIPLGGSRGSTFKTYRNLLLIFLITGFWHGAGWSYIIWGLYHGAFMVIERLGLNRLLERAGAVVQHSYATVVLLFSWVFFRIEDVSYQLKLASSMLGFSDPNSGFFTVSDFSTPLYWFVFSIGVLSSTPMFKNLALNKSVLAFRPMKIIYLTFYIGVLFLCTISLVNNTYNPFIYFRF